ncbi:hypothetical protein FISHEDRAFT_56912 [Fistulina hepatica ATCC 64428]|nr:hypothetical protein FISHEDRAFT_56912 [Fistulina hepatica ATCC 64428]
MDYHECHNASNLFFIHPTPGEIIRAHGYYVRTAFGLPGESPTDELDDTAARGSRCFNCGTPDHMVSECPLPHNRQLVALSRQIFEFYASERSAFWLYPRIHEAEGWRLQRLRWLEEFNPGEIRGDLLREALGTDDAPWLRNMSLWGYPSGWVSPSDPREEVRRRISHVFQSAADEDSDDELDPFIIDTGDDLCETISLPAVRDVNALFRETKMDAGTSITGSEDEPADEVAPTSSPSQRLNEISLSPTRWAQYPDTFFSWEKLTVYRKFALTDSPPAHAPSASSFPVSVSYPESSPPPPPPSTPPPLPPPPPMLVSWPFLSSFPYSPSPPPTLPPPSLPSPLLLAPKFPPSPHLLLLSPQQTKDGIILDMDVNAHSNDDTDMDISDSD